MSIVVGIPDQEIPEVSIYIDRSSAFKGLLVSFDTDLDISAWTFTLSIKISGGAVVFTAVDAAGLDVDTDENKVYIDINQSDVGDLSLDSYLYDLRLERAGENDLWLIQGYIYMQDAVTIS